MKTHPIATVLPLAIRQPRCVLTTRPARPESPVPAAVCKSALDHEQRDIVLTAGTAESSFAADQHRRLLIHALQGLRAHR